MIIFNLRFTFKKLTNHACIWNSNVKLLQILRKWSRYEDMFFRYSKFINTVLSSSVNASWYFVNNIFYLYVDKIGKFIHKKKLYTNFIVPLQRKRKKRKNNFGLFIFYFLLAADFNENLSGPSQTTASQTSSLRWCRKTWPDLVRGDIFVAFRQMKKLSLSSTFVSFAQPQSAFFVLFMLHILTSDFKKIDTNFNLKNTFTINPLRFETLILCIAIFEICASCPFG